MERGLDHMKKALRDKLLQDDEARESDGHGVHHHRHPSNGMSLLELGAEDDEDAADDEPAVPEDAEEDSAAAGAAGDSDSDAEAYTRAIMLP